MMSQSQTVSVPLSARFGSAIHQAIRPFEFHDYAGIVKTLTTELSHLPLTQESHRPYIEQLPQSNDGELLRLRIGKDSQQAYGVTLRICKSPENDQYTLITYYSRDHKFEDMDPIQIMACTRELLVFGLNKHDTRAVHTLIDRSMEQQYPDSRIDRAIQGFRNPGPVFL